MENPDQPQSSEQQPQQPSVPPSIPHKSKKFLFILIALLFLVLIGGGGYYLNSKFKVQNSKLQFKSQNPSPTLATEFIPTISTDPTANPDQIGASWKTYIDTKNGYSIKYPANFKVTKGIDWQTGKTFFEPQIYVTITPNSPFNCKDSCPIISSILDITINGIPVKKAEGTKNIPSGNFSTDKKGPYFVYQFSKNNLYYLLIYEYPSEGEFPNHKEIFNSMASTFKFTDQKTVDISNCATDNDCKSGLICHATQQETIKRCEEQTLGKCVGSSDTSCPSGYQCVQGCGPPIVRDGDNTPIPWYCTANEVANRPKNCPICLASNALIATPLGEVNVKDIKVGMQIWSLEKKGKKIISKVIKTANTLTPINHKVVHLVLSDGRNLWASPNHPATTGIIIGDLRVGEQYDYARITQVKLEPYWDTKTYDLLPDSETGFYFANDIPMGSTLK